MRTKLKLLWVRFTKMFAEYINLLLRCGRIGCPIIGIV
jgi:hypothetical protein